MKLKNFLKLVSEPIGKERELVEVVVKEPGKAMEFSTVLRNAKANMHISEEHLEKKVYSIFSSKFVEGQYKGETAIVIYVWQ